MRWLTPTVPLAMLLLGCKLDNPAFEDGDELADDQTSTETRGDEQDAGSSESASSDQGSSETDTIDGSSSLTSDDPSTTSDSSTSDDPSSSSSESGTTEESGSSSSSESTSEDTSTSDSGDTLDGMIGMCPVTDMLDCKGCIQNMCCFELSDLGCINGLDMTCACVLDCMIDTNNMVDCGAACQAGEIVVDQASGLYGCMLNFCEQWCP